MLLQQHQNRERALLFRLTVWLFPRRVQWYTPGIGWQVKDRDTYFPTP